MNSDVLLFFHFHPQALPLYAQLEEAAAFAAAKRR